jgi:hypothetical protein
MERARHEGVQLLWQSGLLLALLAAYHFWLRWLMQNTGLVLGAVGPGTRVYRLVPLYMHWRPHFKLWLPVAVVTLLAFLWFVRWAIWQRKFPARRLLPLLVIWHIVIAASVAMIDGGPKRIVQPFHDYRATDYIGGVPVVERLGPRQFLSEFVTRAPELPMHCRTHPPGAVLFLWLSQRIWTSDIAAALAVLAVSSLAIPAVYLLAQDQFAHRTAALAAALFMLAPSIVLFSATCLDAVFMAPMVWTVCLIWRAGGHRPVWCGIGAGLAGSIAALMTFSVAFLALWAIAALMLLVVLDRKRARYFAIGLCSAAATSLLLFTLLYLWSGYHVFTNLQVARHQHEQIMRGMNHATWRQHLHLVVANLVAFFAAAGIPLALLWGRQAWQAIRGTEPPAARALTLSFLLALVIIAAAPLFTLEVDHIWLFMVPFLAVAAAAWLARDGDLEEATPAVRWTLGGLALQVVAMETLLHTMW